MYRMIGLPLFYNGRHPEITTEQRKAHYKEAPNRMWM